MRGAPMVKVPQQSRGALAPPDYVRLAEFRYLLRRFLAFSERAAARAGLTAQQHQALLAIKGFSRREAISVGALAERLGVRHHSTVGLVDRLVAKALVERQSSTGDRRRILLRLTPKAERRLAALSLVHRRELKRLAPLLQALLATFGRRRRRGAVKRG